MSSWNGMLGECENCGVENLPICLVEEEGSFGHLVKWKHVSFQNIVTKKGEEKKKLTFVFKSTPSSDLIKYLKSKLQFFTILCLGGKTYNSRIVWRIFLATQLCQWLTSSKTTNLRFKTKCKTCTGIATKWQSWYR